jgi:hypothetical protein
LKDHSFTVAALGLLMAVISCAAALVVVPEVRSLLGLTSSPADSSAVADPQKPQENSPVQARVQSSKPHQVATEIVVDEDNSGNQVESLQEVPVQSPPKRQNKESLAGAFVELYYIGYQSDDVLEVMGRLAGFGATVELHEIYAEEVDATQVIRESPCWDVVGEELESAVEKFGDVRIKTSQDSCDLQPLRLFLVSAR